MLNTGISFDLGVVTRCLTITMIAFMQTSTGIASMVLSGFINMLLSTPLPAASRIPGGPFKESTHLLTLFLKTDHRSLENFLPWHWFFKSWRDNAWPNNADWKRVVMITNENLS